MCLRIVSNVWYANKNEPQHDKTNKMTVHPAITQISLGSAQPDQSFHCALNEKLRIQGFFMRTAKTRISLGSCPGWSESSLGTHIILLILSCCGSDVHAIDQTWDFKLIFVRGFYWHFTTWCTSVFWWYLIGHSIWKNTPVQKIYIPCLVSCIPFSDTLISFLLI